MPDSAGKTVRCRFPTRLRIRRRCEFERVLADGVRISDGRLTVWATRNGLDCARLGLVVGRKHGPAVQRNRLKRLLREAFRLTRQRLPAGLDLVCSPRVGANITLAGCVESLTRLATRLTRRLGEH